MCCFSAERQGSESVIAFSVFIQEKQTFSPKPNRPIPFHHIRLNAGEGWNKNKMKFECRVGGYYGFWFTLGTHILQQAHPKHKNQTNAILVRNNKIIAEAQCRNLNTKAVMMTCESGVVATCDKQEEVWLQSHASINQIHGWNRTSFSGFLIQKL